MSSLDGLNHYDRSAHGASCPCKLCVTYDILLAQQEGTIKVDQWKQGGLDAYITKQRESDLNWELPIGHCLLCGGNVLWAWLVGQHFQRAKWNKKEINGIQYTSLLIHKNGWQIGAYKSILSDRAKIIRWTCAMMDLSPYHATGIASKEHEEWLEIRLGFTQLVAETYEQRCDRYREEHRSSGSAPRGTDSPVQGTIPLARSPIQLHAAGTEGVPRPE